MAKLGISVRRGETIGELPSEYEHILGDEQPYVLDFVDADLTHDEACKPHQRTPGHEEAETPPLVLDAGVTLSVIP